MDIWKGHVLDWWSVVTQLY